MRKIEITVFLPEFHSEMRDQAPVERCGGLGRLAQALRQLCGEIRRRVGRRPEQHESADVKREVPALHQQESRIQYRKPSQRHGWLLSWSRVRQRGGVEILLVETEKLLLAPLALTDLCRRERCRNMGEAPHVRIVSSCQSVLMNHIVRNPFEDLLEHYPHFHAGQGSSKT